MNSIAETVSIEECLKALCSAMVNDSEVTAARVEAEEFLADEVGLTLYREVMTLGQELHMKQHNGESVSEAEATKFNELQSRADGHAGIQKFNQAQEHLQSVANMVNTYVAMSLRDGRVPTEEEVIASQSGCCGGGGDSGGCCNN